MILAEHGTIGMSFGAGDYAHDIRLACHGLDKDDNDFVVGLIGKDLYPLSAIVQTMRKTQQTSLYLERLGPFFVGARASGQTRADNADRTDASRTQSPQREPDSSDDSACSMMSRTMPLERCASVVAPRARQRRLVTASPRCGQRTSGGRAVLRRLLVGVGELDQRRLAPRAAEERDADRQAADEARRHRDVRIAGDRGDGRRAGQPWRCRCRR